MYRKLIAAIAIFSVFSINAQTPTPLPTPIGYSDAWQLLATAAASVNSMPDYATRRGTTSIIPSYNARILFGYGKWLMSSSEEFLGRTLAPLGNNLLYMAIAVASVTGIYMTVRFLVFVLRAAIWLLGWLMRILKLVLAFLKFIRSLIPFI